MELVMTLALSALILPAFDMELLAAAPGALASHATRRHAALRILRPSSTTFPPRLPTLPSAPVPPLAVLDSSPGIAAALAPSRPLRPVTLHIANTRYDSLRLAALFGALISTLKELILILAPDVRRASTRTAVRCAGKHGCGARDVRAESRGHFR
ncbi:hypothetical protein EDB86DRAFT_2962913 [Lactarius hatsudake]|nr:hypothetical protein EDB86DRAFT_2962913 [Lactarius hatsudake]